MSAGTRGDGGIGKGRGAGGGATLRGRLVLGAASPRREGSGALPHPPGRGSPPRVLGCWVPSSRRPAMLSLALA